MTRFVNSSLSRESLKLILKDYEVIPAEHRLKLWMVHILQLPNNKNQYLEIRKNGKKTAININGYTEDDKKGKTICRVIQALIAHCPSLEQFTNFKLIKFVEPFSELLASHELIYFEVILSILVNWCQHWFDHIPLPPYTLLSMMDIILLKNHPELYKHLANRGVRAIDYAWLWMSTALKTIIDPSEWLIVWDHILVNEPNFMYFIPLAACKLQSSCLLKLSTHGQIMEVLHSTTPLDAQSVLKEAYQIQKETPAELRLNQMFHPYHPLIPGYYPTLNLSDMISFHSENTELNQFNNLLTKSEEIHSDVDQIIREGMALRKSMIGM